MKISACSLMPHFTTLRGGLFTTLLAASFTLAAQQPAYNLLLTEPDQELDNFTYRYAGLHHFTSHLRGVQGAGGTLYWVSANGKHLTAYKQGRKLWQADINRAFAKLLPSARIDRLSLSSDVIFLMTTSRGHAEIDRTTGSISALGVDAN